MPQLSHLFSACASGQCFSMLLMMPFGLVFYVVDSFFLVFLFHLTSFCFYKVLLSFQNCLMSFLGRFTQFKKKKIIFLLFDDRVSQIQSKESAGEPVLQVLFSSAYQSMFVCWSFPAHFFSIIQQSLQSDMGVQLALLLKLDRTSWLKAVGYAIWDHILILGNPCGQRASGNDMQ